MIRLSPFEKFYIYVRIFINASQSRKLLLARLDTILLKYYCDFF